MSKGRWMFVSLVAVICGLWLAGHLFSYMVTGSFFAINIVEKLEDPAEVEGWSAAGLQLADGRTVQLPGFSALPEESQVLEKATEHGVEVGADGRVTGLIDVWHSCGNDPVRDHVARVDLAYLLMYAHEGEFTDPPQDPMDWPPDMMPYVIESRRSFSKYGWRSGQFARFQRYVEQAG